MDKLSVAKEPASAGKTLPLLLRGARATPQVLGASASKEVEGAICLRKGKDLMLDHDTEEEKNAIVMPQDYSISKTPRSANGAAHDITAYARLCVSSGVLTGSVLLLFDWTGRSL